MNEKVINFLDEYAEGVVAFLVVLFLGSLFLFTYYQGVENGKAALLTFTNTPYDDDGFLNRSYEAGFNYYKCKVVINDKIYYDESCMKQVDNEKEAITGLD